MNNFKEELNNKLYELKQLELQTERRLKRYKGLEKGNIRACTHNGVTQYYLKKMGDDKEHYIPKIEMNKIKLLVQRDYDEKVKKIVEEMINRLDKFNRAFDVDIIDRAYTNLSAGRRELIDPILPTRQMIIEEWYKNHPGNMNTFEIKHEFMTIKGEAVRSKSEKMIADYLSRKGIPYVCESEVVLKDGRKVYPDFAALNVKKNKTIYIEHLGLVSQERYATKNFYKLIDYEDVGIVLGDNLIITIETEERPLDMKVAEKKIASFLL
ncbi:MAG: hypothetical protein K6E91_00605 [Butyrivibrio sp.]|nr:hypothetical protein [Butyrivibrio sp.]